MFDWHGEFNTYVVPFAPFGAPDRQPALLSPTRATSSARSPTPPAPTSRSRRSSRSTRSRSSSPSDGRSTRTRPAARAIRSRATSAASSATTSAARTSTARCDFTPLDPHREAPLDDRRHAPARQRRVRHRPRAPARHGDLLDVRGHERLRRRRRDAERAAADHADRRRLRHGGRPHATTSSRCSSPATRTATGCSTSARPGSTPRRASSPTACEPGLYTNTVTVEARAADGGTTADTAENRHAGSVDRLDRDQEGGQRGRRARADARRGGRRADRPGARGRARRSSGPTASRTTTATALAASSSSTTTARPTSPATTSTPPSSAGDTDGDGLLDPGEIWLYRAFGTPSLGQYANVGLGHRDRRARRRSPPTTRAHYLGTTGIRIVKLANGDDANAAPGAVLPIGAPLVYTYLVYGESAVAAVRRRRPRRQRHAGRCSADDFTPLYVERRRQRERAARLRRDLAVHLAGRRRRPLHGAASGRR